MLVGVVAINFWIYFSTCREASILLGAMLKSWLQSDSWRRLSAVAMVSMIYVIYIYKISHCNAMLHLCYI